MDKNTITGIILIFLIFIGFSIYSNSRNSKGFQKAIEVAESYYNKGDMENARAEYINALRFKPNQPDIVAKVNEINIKLGIGTENTKADTSEQKQQASQIPVSITQEKVKDIKLQKALMILLLSRIIRSN
jgi:hypothetical protein